MFSSKAPSIVVVAMASLWAANIASAQQGSGTGTNPLSRTRSSSASSGGVPTADSGRPIFLSGKVAMEDNTLPPEPVAIQRVCSGEVRLEGYTDSKGRFFVQLGGDTGALRDASVGSGDPVGSSGSSMSNVGAQPSISERDLIGCDLRAYLTGYISDEIPLAGRRTLDRSEVGTIVLHRAAGVEGIVSSGTSAAASKDAVKAYGKGLDAIKKEKWADARKQFEKAVELHPQYATAWLQLGRSRERLGDSAAAHTAYERAIAADPKYLPPQIQLADLVFKEQNWPALQSATDRILKLDPVNLPGVYVANSIACLMTQNLDAAEKSAREALKLDTRGQFPKANHVLGMVLAQRGDFRGASEFMKKYLELAPKAADAQVAKQQLVQAEQLAQGKTGVSQ